VKRIRPAPKRRRFAIELFAAIAIEFFSSNQFKIPTNYTPGNLAMQVASATFDSTGPQKLRGRREIYGDWLQRLEMKADGFAGTYPDGRSDGARDDDLAGAKGFAKLRQKIGDVADVGD